MTEFRFIGSSKRAVSISVVLTAAETMHHLEATLYQQREENTLLLPGDSSTQSEP